MSFRKSKQTIKRPRSSFHRAYRSVQPWLHRRVTSRAPRIPVTTCDSRMLTAVVLLSRGRSTDCEPVNAHSSVRIILSHISSHRNLAYERFGVNIGMQTHHPPPSVTSALEADTGLTLSMSYEHQQTRGLQRKASQELELCQYPGLWAMPARLLNIKSMYYSMYKSPVFKEKGRLTTDGLHCRPHK